MTESDWQHKQPGNKLPDNPNLEQLKNQAKDIRKAHKSGDEDACNTLKLLERFKGHSNQRILAAKVSLHEVQHALALSYDFVNWSQMSKTIAISNGAPDSRETDPVTNFVNKMLINAINSGATDLVFEPYEDTYRVCYRIDGIDQVVAQPPVKFGPKIADKLRSISSIDAEAVSGRMTLKISKTTEGFYYLIQDGREVGDTTVCFQMSILPTTSGEQISVAIENGL